jgi:hypothetical protein
VSSLPTLIGQAFERRIQQDFPEFEDTTNEREASSLDFRCNGILFEAKVGNNEWGPRPKKDQIEAQALLRTPVLYILGYHDFYHASERTRGMNEEEIAKLLDRQMHILEAYFVSLRVMQAIWAADFAISPTTGDEYLLVDRQTPHHIVHDEPFKRAGDLVTVRGFYGLNTSGLLRVAPHQNGHQIPYGCIVGKRQRQVVEFVNEALGLAPF